MEAQINTHISTDTHLVRRSFNGLGWTFLGHIASKGVNLLTLSILAHLLRKDAFGLVAIAVIALNYLYIINDLGLGQALIQKRGDIEESASTVFTLNLGVGVLLTVLTYLSAPLVAAYFEEPDITNVLRLLGITFLLNALGSIHIMRLQRELDFKKKVVPDFASSAVKGVVSIALAFAGAGVWALVFGQLAGALASVIAVWIVFPWRPLLTINILLARDLLKYGLSIMGSQAVMVMTENVVPLLIGKFLGLSMLAIYSIAYRLPEMLLISMLWVIGRVAFPAFSTIQNEKEILSAGFIASTRMVQSFSTPICIGLFVAADPIIRVIFGNQWLEAIPLLRVTAVYAYVYALGFHAGAVYKAIGRPDILFKLSMFSLILIFISVLIGMNYGLLGIVTAQLCAMSLRRIVSLAIACRFINVSISELIASVEPSLKSGVVLVILAMPTLYITLHSDPLLRLICVSVIGSVGYIVSFYFQEKNNLLHLMQMYKQKI